MKFVVWGAGRLGRIVLAYLGRKRIAAIIDSNCDLQGQSLDEVPIISFTEYMDRYKYFPIIVTPLFHEREIINYLFSKGIRWAFPFSEYRSVITPLFGSTTPEEVFEQYGTNTRVDIWGVNLLSLLVYDVLKVKGCPCQIVWENKDDIVTFIEEVLHIKTCDINKVNTEGVRLILTRPCKKEGNRYRYESVEKLYEIMFQFERFANPKLEVFRNIHKNQRCFIIGNGPSLTAVDLERLHRHNEICMGVNAIFYIYGKTNWRPTYYMVSDEESLIAFKDDLFERVEAKACFVADSMAKLDKKNMPLNVFTYHVFAGCSDANNKGPFFSDDFSKVAGGGNTVIYDCGLQLAAYMGFSEIYLLGTDCSLNKDAKREHFYPEEPESLGVWPFDEVIASYKVAKEYMDNHGIKIYNATRGGNLEVFERVEFDSLFSN